MAVMAEIDVPPVGGGAQVGHCPDLAPAQPEYASLRLVRVLRENNPKRRDGHVLPALGKLDGLDVGVLQLIADAARDALEKTGWTDERRRRTLVVGLAEASLVPAWFVARRLAARLCLTTREWTERVDGALYFNERHSHASRHALRLPAGEHEYDDIVIVEDEVTSGNTLCNLLDCLKGYTKRFHVVAVADLTSSCEPLLREVVRSSGSSLTVSALLRPRAAASSAAIPPEHAAACAAAAAAAADKSRGGSPCGPPLPSPPPSPATSELGDDEAAGAAAPLVFAFGECISSAMAIVVDAPASSPAPRLRHVSRSPWEVDGTGVRERWDVGCDAFGVRHFLYNPPASRELRGAACQLCFHPWHRPMAARLAAELRGAGAAVVLHEVPARAAAGDPLGAGAPSPP